MEEDTEKGKISIPPEVIPEVEEPTQEVITLSNREIPITSNTQVDQESPKEIEAEKKQVKKTQASTNVKHEVKKPTKISKVKTTNETKPKRETLYDKALKQCGLSQPKGKKRPKTAKSLKGGLLIDSDRRLMYIQLRESLLELQKKDAITRQTLEKLQKEKAALEEEGLRKKGLIAKCEKSRETDGTTIARQEELIAKLRIEEQANTETNKPIKEILKTTKERNERLQELKTSLTNCKEEKIFDVNQVKELIEREDLSELINVIGKGCDACELTIKNYEDCLVKVQGHVEDIEAEYSEEKSKVKRIISSLKKERVNDQKRLLDLQRRLAYAVQEYEQDKSKLVRGDLLMSVNLNSDENNVMDKVDEILSNLKDKLVASGAQNSEETNQMVNQITSPRTRKRKASSHK